jgi:3-deoxy-7-phosphoheptulonate synthase
MKLLPSYKELKSQFPLTPSQHAFIKQSRQATRAILNGTDPRLLLIIGPCSIHDIISAKEFATQLNRLATQLSSQFLILMRVYCEKPRTSSGWKGLLYDPFLDGSHDMLTGISWTRQLFLDLADLQLPAATEFLDPLTAFYYEDLITWGSIGARTSSSQTHRQLASGLNMPIGMKNGVAGTLSTAINGVISVNHSHIYMGLSQEAQPAIIQTAGNPDAHVVLRGSEYGPNFDPDSVDEALTRLKQHQLPQRLIIDCSHHNSGKNFEQQPYVFQSVFKQILEGNQSIRGLMLESHLKAGNQSLMTGPYSLKYGISITDGCLDWSSTEQLILWASQLLQENSAHSFR